MRLVFVRHGEPDYQHDCLTEVGKEQAAKTAIRLKGEDIKAIYASPMGRAVETASYTAKDHGLEIIPLNFMHEIDWGHVKEGENLEHDGHPWSLGYKLLIENPEYIGSSAWDEHHYFKNNRCLDYYKLVAEGFDKFLASLGLVRKNGIYEYERENNDTIALFAHGGSGAVMFSHVLNLPFPFVLTTLPYGVCSVSIIDFEAQMGNKAVPRLELFNDMGHLGNYGMEKLHFDK